MSKGLLLLVDDTVNNLKVLSDCLTSNGYEVRCATSGELALQALEFILPELILLDIRMPGMDGFETCRRIKENPRIQGIPVIFISAMQEMDERIRAFEVGGVDFVTKPFQEREVLARVSAHVSLYQAQRQLRSLLQTTSEEYAAFQKRVEILFGAMDEAVGLFQKQGHQDKADYYLIECNPAFEKMIGSPKEMILGKVGSEIFKNNRKQFLNEIAEKLPSMPHLQIPLQAFGFRKYYRTSATIMDSETIALVLTEVSDLVRSQEDLEVRTNEMESVIHVLSHDLRSPLLNIQGFRRELLDELNQIFPPGSGGIKDTILVALGMIDKNSKKMDSLIRGLSLVARTGRRQFVRELVNMKELLSGVIDSNKDLWNAYGEYRIEFGDLPDCIADRAQVDAVFGNLLANSIQYRHPQRIPMIQITGEVLDDVVVYCISDNGRGIAPLHLTRVWDLFYRGDSTENIGEGLGLPIVRKIVDKLEGRTWLESEVNIGTKVYVELKSAEG